MRKTLSSLALFTLLFSFNSFAVSDAEFQALQQRVDFLEKIILRQNEDRLNSSASPGTETEVKNNEQIVVEQKLNARERIALDRRNYAPAELSKIELLFAEIERDVDSPAARNNLKTLIHQYRNANRTGCAFLKVGQLSRGPERAAYLKKAINEFSDCYFANGAQVGALAHFILAQYYTIDNKPVEARDILARLKKNFPEAIDHNDRLLSEFIPDLEALLNRTE